MPPPPKSFEDMEEENLDQMFTKNDSGEFWYHQLRHPDALEEFDIVFISYTGAKALSSMKYWSVDGTFDCCAVTKYFKQLWIIACRTGVGSYVPVCFALLTGKKQENYQRVLEFLANTMQIKDPDFVCMDYERAEHKAFSEVYPSSVLLGCDVHWKRNLIRGIKKHGLQADINKSVSLSVWFHKLWSLSLVPRDSVVKVFEYIITITPWKDTSLPPRDEEELKTWNKYNDNLRFFTDYFERTYIGQKNSSGGRKNPLFGKELWNKSESISRDQDLNTNASESINLQFTNGLDGKRGKTFGHVILAIKKEETKSLSTMMEAAGGEKTGDHNPARRDRLVRYKEERKKLVDRFGEVDLDVFLSKAASMFEKSNLMN